VQFKPEWTDPFSCGKIYRIPQGGGWMSKRTEMRDRRKRERQRNRLLAIVIVGGIAVLFAAVLIIPGAPDLGQIIQPQPRNHPMADGMAMGDPNAPVLFEVFEDFQCPACKTFTEASEDFLIGEYITSGNVYYVFRQFPFIGPESFQAAYASACAADQGLFWPYHDYLFANQSGENLNSFSNDRLLEFARLAGLDVEPFTDCLRDRVHRNAIELEIAEGRDRGVGGTPAIFVNGEQISPGFVPSLADLQEAIEAALGASG
jgi:protein-disulfide isomerase